MPVNAQVQVGQRVLPMGVRAVLGDQHARTERPQPRRVTRARRDRDIHRGAARRAVTALGRETRAGKQRQGLWWIDTVSTRGSS